MNYNDLPKNPQAMIVNLLSIELQQLFYTLPNAGYSDLSAVISLVQMPRHFIKLIFINKGIDAVNLPLILRSKSVTETVPTYLN